MVNNDLQARALALASFGDRDQTSLENPFRRYDWGGTCLYAGSGGSALPNTTQNFIQYYEDLKLAAIVTGDLTIESLVYVWGVFYLYDGTAPALGSLR